MQPDISISSATPDDSVAVFEWRNDDSTRRASVSQGAVPWAEHERWFAAVLASSERFLYLGREGEARVGLCRFDLDERSRTAEVSINLNPDFRGKGYAGALLRACIERFRADAGAGIPLTATIRPENAASMRIFAAQGFVLSASEPGLDHFELRG